MCVLFLVVKRWRNNCVRRTQLPVGTSSRLPVVPPPGTPSGDTGSSRTGGSPNQKPTASPKLGSERLGQLVRQILLRVSVTFAGEVCSTLRWREMDSNHWSLSEGMCCKGRKSLRGDLPSGPGGSNPSSSSGESTTNRAVALGRELRAPPSSASQPKSAGASADNSTNRAGSPPAIAALRSTVY